MQTKLASDDLDLLAWGVCPECGESYCLVEHDDSHYECECGWVFTVSDGEVLASNDRLDRTTFDVLS
jgi:hypothetical protein